MYTIDISTVGHFMQSFFALVGGALGFDPAAFSAIQMSKGADVLTLFILILAGISVTLGQSVVLLANKVTPRRFIVSLLANGAIFAVKVLIWAAIFQLVTRLLFGMQPSFPEIARGVGLAFAPMLLGFFILLPYLGAFLSRVLDIWSALAMLVALQAILNLRFWQALVCALIGFGIIQLLKYTIGRPIVALERWLRQIIAGVPLSYRMQELVSVGDIKDEEKGP
jgi:hypothetical protein